MKNRTNSRKKWLAVLLSVSMLPTAVLQNGSMVYAEESRQEEAAETEEALENRETVPVVEEISISNKEEFLKFAKKCQDDYYSYGRVFNLQDDIDLSGSTFEGIPYFAGTFNGNGHTVSGFKISREGSDYGFFRYVGKNGRVKDLNVSGSVKVTGSAENVAGLTAVNYGILENCSFDGDVSGDTNVGGIVGENRADGIVLTCRNTGTIVGTNEVGGICGMNRGIIQNCENEGKINDEDLKTTLDLNGIDIGTLNLTQNVVTRNDAGGIAGRSSGTVAGCTNKGEIGYAHIGYNVGGVIGRQSGTVINCKNMGHVMGRKDVGGIIGQAEPYRESEYLSDHLEKVKDDFSEINHLMGQMSDAMSSVSSDTRGYVQTLQQQYEDTMGNLDSEINSMKNTVTGNNAAMTAYMDSLSSALNNLGEIGNDTISRMMESIRQNTENAANNINGKLNDIKDVLTETPSESSSASESGSESSSESSSSEESSSQESSSSEESSSAQESPAESEQPSSNENGGAESQSSNNEEAAAIPADDAAEYLAAGEAEEGYAWFAKDGESSSSEESSSGWERPSEWPSELPSTLPSEWPSELPSESISIPSQSEVESKADAITDIINKDPIKVNHDGKIDDNLNQMKGEISSASDNIKNLQSTLSGTGDSLTDTMSNISGELTDQSKASGDTIDSMTDSIDGGIQSITGDLDVILSTSSRITDIISDDVNVLLGNGSTVLDVSDEAVTERMLGVISGCNNHGKIEGDINAGGIAGIMNTEYDVDPEVDMDLSELTDVEVRSTTNDVLIHCINYGTVAGKKRNSGGIAGSEELGLIHACENYGTVQLESGNDLGGIAGYSVSRVNKSYALCNLKGDNKIGGITGEGYDISNCLAMVTISGNRTEKIGSIAGCINEDGTLENNYFVSDLWGGVDQINYIGKAQRCTYEELMQMETVPEGFTQVTVTFELDDEVLATLQIPYDGTVTAEEVPDIEPDEDCYISWDKKFPLTHVTSNVTVTAESKRFTKSLAWFAGANQLKPDFLVEGDFYDTSVLSAESVQADTIPDGNLAYAYTWNIDNLPEQKEEYVLHLRIPDGADSAVVRVQTDKKWKKAAPQVDGSYVTVSVPYGAAFAVYAVQDNSVPVWLVIAIAAAAVLAAVLIGKAAKRGKKRVKKRREKRRKKKQEQTDSQ